MERIEIIGNILIIVISIVYLFVALHFVEKKENQKFCK